MAERNNEFEVRNLVRLAVNAFYDGEYANFSTKNLAECGIGEKKIQYHLKELCKENELENCTVNGFYSRYKITSPTVCPNFIFDDNITPGQRLFLIRCMNNLPDYEPRPAKDVNKFLNGASSQTSKMMSTIKSKGRTIFEILNNAEEIHKSPSHEEYPVLKTEFGYQIQTMTIQSKEEYKCQYCGTTDKHNFYKSHITCKYCMAERNRLSILSTPAKFLYSKAMHGFKRRAYIKDFTITEKDIQEQLIQQNNLDYYTGIELISEDMSLDRLDSSIGYIPGNIVITHKVINVMKNNLSIKEFKEYIEALHNNINNF